MPEPTDQTLPGLEDLDQRLDALARHGASRADLATAGELRVRAARVQRRRRATATALVAAAACAAGLLAFGSPFAGHATRDLPAGPVRDPRHLVASLPARPVEPASRTVTAGGTVAFDVPAGWLVYREGGGLVAPADLRRSGTDLLCLAPGAAPGAQAGACGSLSVAVGRLYGAEGAGPYRPHQAMGWYTGTDVGPCPVGRPSTPGDLNGIEGGGAPVASGFRPVGSHEATYDRWAASCQDGSVFSPQAWFLPQSHVLVKQLVPAAGVAEVLASARFGREDPRLPGAPHLVEGRLVAATPGGVRLRVHGRSVDLVLTDLTGCVGGAHLVGDDAPAPVPCATFAAWAREHPGTSFVAGAYVTDAGEVETLVEP